MPAVETQRLPLDEAQVAEAAEPQDLRAVFGRLPAGVSVVTAFGADGPRGMTVSAACSLSLDPPLVLACFRNSCSTLETVRAAGRFGLNVLRAGQRDVSSAFAGGCDQEGRFSMVPYSLDHGVPILENTLAWAACLLGGLIEAGDHTIGIGLVEATEHRDGEPLVWHRGSYRSLAGTGGAR